MNGWWLRALYWVRPLLVAIVVTAIAKLPLGVGSPPTLTPAFCLSLRPLFSFLVGYLAELSRGAISFVALVAERLETLTAFGDEGVSISALAVRVHT